MYVFGYGSLMNPRSLARTLPGERRTLRAILQGYSRICNAEHGEYAYLNLIPSQGSTTGTLVEISSEELDILKVRESGYECIDVSKHVRPQSGAQVFIFIAPSGPNQYQVPRSYLDTCLLGVPLDEQEEWLRDTILPFGIFEDRLSPVYENIDPRLIPTSAVVESVD